MKLEKETILKIQIFNAILFSIVLVSVGCSGPEESKKTNEPEVTKQPSSTLTIPKSEPDDSEGPKKLAAGDKAPDFEIELMGGEMLKLSDHVKNCGGPTILLFDRAHW